MLVNKVAGKIIGAHFTVSEKKAIDLELRKELAEYDKKHARELDALVLWELHQQFGFGPKRLKKFYDGFFLATKDLLNRYEMNTGDEVWLCTQKLKEIGADLEAWEKENRL